MAIAKPFNLQKWIKENKELLKPPVSNKNLYVDSMVPGLRSRLSGMLKFVTYVV